MKIIDLTLPLYTGMPVYPGDPEASIALVHTIKNNGWDMLRLQINAFARAREQFGRRGFAAIDA